VVIQANTDRSPRAVQRAAARAEAGDPKRMRHVDSESSVCMRRGRAHERDFNDMGRLLMESPRACAMISKFPRPTSTHSCSARTRSTAAMALGSWRRFGAACWPCRSDQTEKFVQSIDGRRSSAPRLMART